VPAARRMLIAATLVVALACAACSPGGGMRGPDGTVPGPAGSDGTEATMTTLELTSPAFTDGGAIPRRHSCDGPDVSPALAWTGAPAGTAAFALLVEDPDARGFVHWVVASIPGDATGLSEGVPAAGPPAQGRNDFGRVGWGGPCPPSGTHRYVFTLYALREKPMLTGTPTARDLRRAIEGRVLAEARLVGTYRR